MKRIAVYLLISLVFLAACTKKKVNVDVYVNFQFIRSNKVIIDDTLILRKDDCANQFCKFVLKSGEHTLSINNTKETLKIGKLGGILNIAHQDFVIFPIKYSSPDNAIADAVFTTDMPIIIDSLIVYEKNVARNQDDLIEFLKKPEAKEILSNSKLEKFGKDQLFINKSWDYGMYEELPKTIESKYVATHIRKVIDAKLFLIYAKFNDEYIVEPIVNKGLVELIENLKATKRD